MHGYHRSLEADILYIIFSPLHVCHNIEFLLKSILLFYLLTLPRELLSIILIKFHLLKYLNVIGSSPCDPKFWQSLTYSRSSSPPEQYAREDSGSITLEHEDFFNCN